MKNLIPLLIAAPIVLGGVQLALAKPKTNAKPRTLEEIQIEGQVDIPRVLFISSRERVKTNEFHHHRYQKTAEEIAEGAYYPRRLTTKKEQ